MKKTVIASLLTLVTLAALAPAAAQEGGQPLAPQQLTLWMVGFHPDKNDPQVQVLAHHFCHQLREDLAQCVLYDGDGPEARMIGIEYIIPAEAYEQLPEEERSYWHPHNFEVLSGQLNAPGVEDDTDMVAALLNSYGKTWHTWDAGVFDPASGSFVAEGLPTEEPRLMWSFNHLGEAHDGMIEAGLQPYGIDTDAKRQARQELVGQAEPQCGVNLLVAEFDGDIQQLEGVAQREGGC